MEREDINIPFWGGGDPQALDAFRVFMQETFDRDEGISSCHMEDFAKVLLEIADGGVFSSVGTFSNGVIAVPPPKNIALKHGTSANSAHGMSFFAMDTRALQKEGYCVNIFGTIDVLRCGAEEEDEVSACPVPNGGCEIDGLRSMTSSRVLFSMENTLLCRFPMMAGVLCDLATLRSDIRRAINVTQERVLDFMQRGVRPAAPPHAQPAAEGELMAHFLTQSEAGSRVCVTNANRNISCDPFVRMQTKAGKTTLKATTRFQLPASAGGGDADIVELKGTVDSWDGAMLSDVRLRVGHDGSKACTVPVGIFFISAAGMTTPEALAFNLSVADTIDGDVLTACELFFDEARAHINTNADPLADLTPFDAALLANVRMPAGGETVCDWLHDAFMCTSFGHGPFTRLEKINAVVRNLRALINKFLCVRSEWRRRRFTGEDRSDLPVANLGLFAQNDTRFAEFHMPSSLLTVLKDAFSAGWGKFICKLAQVCATKDPEDIAGHAPEFPYRMVSSAVQRALTTGAFATRVGPWHEPVRKSARQRRGGGDAGEPSSTKFRVVTSATSFTSNLTQVLPLARVQEANTVLNEVVLLFGLERIPKNLLSLPPVTIGLCSETSDGESAGRVVRRDSMTILSTLPLDCDWDPAVEFLRASICGGYGPVRSAESPSGAPVYLDGCYMGDLEPGRSPHDAVEEIMIWALGTRRAADTSQQVALRYLSASVDRCGCVNVRLRAGRLMTMFLATSWVEDDTGRQVLVPSFMLEASAVGANDHGIPCISGLRDRATGRLVTSLREMEARGWVVFLDPCSIEYFGVLGDPETWEAVQRAQLTRGMWFAPPVAPAWRDGKLFPFLNSLTAARKDIASAKIPKQRLMAMLDGDATFPFTGGSRSRLLHADAALAPTAEAIMAGLCSPRGCAMELRMGVGSICWGETAEDASPMLDVVAENDMLVLDQEVIETTLYASQMPFGINLERMREMGRFVEFNQADVEHLHPAIGLPPVGTVLSPGQPYMYYIMPHTYGGMPLHARCKRIINRPGKGGRVASVVLARLPGAEVLSFRVWITLSRITPLRDTDKEFWPPQKVTACMRVPREDMPYMASTGEFLHIMLSSFGMLARVSVTVVNLSVLAEAHTARGSTLPVDSMLRARSGTFAEQSFRESLVNEPATAEDFCVYLAAALGDALALLVRNGAEAAERHRDDIDAFVVGFITVMGKLFWTDCTAHMLLKAFVREMFTIGAIGEHEFRAAIDSIMAARLLAPDTDGFHLVVDACTPAEHLRTPLQEWQADLSKVVSARFLDEHPHMARSLGPGFCSEVVMCPTTGRILDAGMMCGTVPVFPNVHRAVHQSVVNNDITQRNAVTRLPPQGQSKGGYTRMGYMEILALVVLSMWEMLNNLRCNNSNGFFVEMCTRCGLFGTLHGTSVRESVCTVCAEQSRVRSVKINFGFVLITQIALTAGVELRLRFEEEEGEGGAGGLLDIVPAPEEI